MLNKDILCCPRCKGSIDNEYYCKACDIKYPTIKNKPILINEENSIFRFSDYNEDDSFSFFKKRSRFKDLAKFIPVLDVNYAASKNYALLPKLLMERTETPLILVIGGGIIGKGMQTLMENPNLKFIHTDVSFAEVNQMVCDGHDLPFKDASFNGVIIQAVLEHVVDPYRCVEEIHRVLADGGIVYAETPFMQQVHAGAYDFTRFTWLGHRRLFRKFEEVESGTCCGPAAALSWSWHYFLRSFARRRGAERIAQAFAGFSAFYLKYFDHILKNKPNSIDASSGNYFIGRKKEGYIFSDRDLIDLYEEKKKSFN